MRPSNGDPVVISDDDASSPLRPQMNSLNAPQLSNKTFIDLSLDNEYEPLSRLQHNSHLRMGKSQGIMDKFTRPKKVVEHSSTEGRDLIEERTLKRKFERPESSKHDTEDFPQGSFRKAASLNTNKRPRLARPQSPKMFVSAAKASSSIEQHHAVTSNGPLKDSPLASFSGQGTSLQVPSQRNFFVSSEMVPGLSVSHSDGMQQRFDRSGAEKNSSRTMGINQLNDAKQRPAHLHKASSSCDVSKSRALFGSESLQPVLSTQVSLSDTKYQTIRKRSNSPKDSSSELSTPADTLSSSERNSIMAPLKAINKQHVDISNERNMNDNKQRQLSSKDNSEQVISTSSLPTVPPKSELSGRGNTAAFDKDDEASPPLTNTTNLSLNINDDAAITSRSFDGTYDVSKDQENVGSAPSCKKEFTSRMDIEKYLEECYQVLKDDTALTAMFSLHDAKLLNRQFSTSPFVDKVSPWKQMKRSQTPVAGSKGVTTKFETRVMERTNNHNTKLRPVVRSYVVPRTIRDKVPSVPRFITTTTVKRNFLTTDDDVLRYVPYFAENDDATVNHKRLLKELEASYTNLGPSTRDMELCSQIREQIDQWLPGVDLTKKTLQRYILDRRNQDFKLHTELINSLLQDLGGPLANPIVRQARDFTDSFKSVFDVDLADVILPESFFKDYEEASKAKRTQTSNDLETFSTFAAWMCVICGVPYCQVHGDFRNNEMPINEEDTTEDDLDKSKVDHGYTPLGLSTHDLFHNTKSLFISENARRLRANSVSSTIGSRPCATNECWMNVPEHVSTISCPQWSEQKLSLLEEFATSFVHPQTRSCIIAAGIDMPCWQVNLKLQDMEVSQQKRTDPAIEAPLEKINDRPQWYNNEKKVLHQKWRNMTKIYNHETSTQLSICAHEGPCTAGNCGCHANGVLCERWCLCSDNCGRRFTGCKCTEQGLACIPESCICLQMSRECGPECGTCGAVARLDPHNKYNEDLFKTGCQNIAIQRGVSKRIVLGESTLEGIGFGAYAAEYMPKGAYIGEYRGEVTTYKESERRAIIYERKHSSYLFDRNKGCTIDAARHGDKTRFINHAPHGSKRLNVGVSVLFANGEHHIKMFAIRDIKAGEELFFDYGGKFKESHLRDKLDAISEKKTTGALTGEEALDALDGRGGNNRVKRKRADTAPGDKSGNSSKKARSSKTASTTKVVEPEEMLEVADSDGEDDDYHHEDEEVSMSNLEQEEEEEDTVYNEEDSDDEASNMVRKRPKRSVQKPSRYTR